MKRQIRWMLLGAGLTVNVASFGFEFLPFSNSDAGTSLVVHPLKKTDLRYDISLESPLQLNKPFKQKEGDIEKNHRIIAKIVKALQKVQHNHLNHTITLPIAPKNMIA